MGYDIQINGIDKNQNNITITDAYLLSKEDFNQINSNFDIVVTQREQIKELQKSLQHLKIIINIYLYSLIIVVSIISVITIFNMMKG